MVLWYKNLELKANFMEVNKVILQAALLFLNPHIKDYGKVASPFTISFGWM